MCVLRALIVAVLLASGPAAALAQNRPPLTNIDRELNALCARLDGASGSGAAAIRSRLAVLWRQRVAYFESIPPNRRLAEQRLGIATAQCLTMAKAAAEPQQVVAPRTGGGGGGRRQGYSAPRQPPPAEAPPPAANGGPRAPGPTAAPQPPRPTPREPIAGAAAELEEFFPWPPPAPSDRRLMRLTQPSGEPLTTWGQVSDRILAQLRRGQFRTRGFYAAPDGFAIVTPIEQLDDQSGDALAGDDRWASETKVASTNILQGIFTVRRPKGLYRVFCFVLTTDARSGGEVTDPARMLQLAKRWGRGGVADLPDYLRDKPVLSAHRLYVLVYEFESAVGGATSVNSPGRWTFERHGKDAGILTSP